MPQPVTAALPFNPPSPARIALGPPARMRRIELSRPVVLRSVGRVSPLRRPLLAGDLLDVARALRGLVVQLPRRRSRLLLLAADLLLSLLARSCVLFRGFHDLTLEPDRCV